ncbi:hypothetical protein BKG69_21995 [Mycobacteroides chelonae]|uniref:Uncharacterized protein n=1 Tax=Mycobacteroides chelonae TaxID=1774 RepID=A0AB73M0S2_MYCCH|nr:hypothetical protein AOT83_12675 [Mycobacteroides sp. H001]OHT49545.1 hypothetical protein BKG62_18360 [Mycobacteroides chelonae]OHT73040.1 hypothetical protein BKG66_09625 [Mycobacteroides chelonae]OHT77090.1 hypothetical protein BKG69_21995 [Mycobacteroides chelonae]OHU03611.1 hypothetical protein BKG71_10100 [Mycobacteroides chelonae]
MPTTAAIFTSKVLLAERGAGAGACGTDTGFVGVSGLSGVVMPRAWPNRLTIAQGKPVKFL